MEKPWYKTIPGIATIVIGASTIIAGTLLYVNSMSGPNYKDLGLTKEQWAQLDEATQSKLEELQKNGDSTQIASILNIKVQGWGKTIFALEHKKNQLYKQINTLPGGDPLKDQMLDLIGEIQNDESIDPIKRFDFANSLYSLTIDAIIARNADPISEQTAIELNDSINSFSANYVKLKKTNKNIETAFNLAFDNIGSLATKLLAKANTHEQLLQTNPTYKANWNKAKDLFVAKTGEIVPQIINQNDSVTENDVIAFKSAKYFFNSQYPEEVNTENKANFLFFSAPNNDIRMKYAYGTTSYVGDSVVQAEFNQAMLSAKQMMKTTDLTRIKTPIFVQAGISAGLNF